MKDFHQTHPEVSCSFPKSIKHIL